jgi:hypothetical protein
MSAYAQYFYNKILGIRFQHHSSLRSNYETIYHYYGLKELKIWILRLGIREL